ncbi:LD-carboxypeptidase [Aurantibacter sp.]|uniref:S66 peptidase family protein n=1 Tax=Aurantibacter sp. TaxID=2807103 RepID=UPI0035C80938
MSKKALIVSCLCVFFFFGSFSVNAQQLAKNLNSKALIQPPFLKAGDTVAIVAPAGILKNRTQEIRDAVSLLKKWGLNAVVGKNVFNNGGHFAGTDEERCEDFQSALDNPNIKAIWSARGGYGSVRVLDLLDYTQFKNSPKWIIGYSDITAFHNQMNVLGFQSIHAIMCTSVTDELKENPESVTTFKKSLFGENLSYTLESSKYNRIGEVKGQLVGGNLAILTSMLGSKTSLATKGKILFIEEIGEYAYSIDRMLQSLKRAGYFKDCAGLIIGDMSKVKKNTTKFGKPVQQIILDVVADYNFPVAFNMKAGHEPDNRALIFGAEIELKVSSSGSKVIFE